MALLDSEQYALVMNNATQAQREQVCSLIGTGAAPSREEAAHTVLKPELTPEQFTAWAAAQVQADSAARTARQQQKS